jgi:hypothetical protein
MTRTRLPAGPARKANFPRASGRVARCVALVALLVSTALASTTIRVHPDNPRLFQWRGKTTVLVGSTEHYGAVLNLDFDYRTYLDTLHAAGLNITRTVPGTAVISPTARVWRGLEQNTIGPRPGKYLAPWARSSTPGYAGGGNKFDLDRWDEVFFARLRDFVRLAAERGIVVEITLLYVVYGEGPEQGHWSMHPLNVRNNINGVGRCAFDRYNTLDEPALVARQEAVVRKIATELNPFDNVIYEICDEPYLSGASPAETEAWQNRMLEAFDGVRRTLPNRQLVAINPANLYARLDRVHPAADWVNFHYCTPPAAAPMNEHLGLPLGFDETPGKNVHGLAQRAEAWAWLFSGGALYNNLDPSFATDDATGSGRIRQEDGTFDGRAMRAQFRVLLDFMHGLDLARMRPTERLLQLRGGKVRAPAPYVLASPGRQYAVYFPRGTPAPADCMFDLPAGEWRVEWLSPETGRVEAGPTVRHAGGALRLQSPRFTADLALRLTNTREATLP